jgi:hypothetical protein
VDSKGCRIFEGPCEEKLVTDFFTGVGSRARRARRVRETEGNWRTGGLLGMKCDHLLDSYVDSHTSSIIEKKNV